MTNWEMLFGDPERTADTLTRDFQCLMGCLGYECVKDEKARNPCPLYDHPDGCSKGIREWLQEEAS